MVGSLLHEQFSRVGPETAEFFPLFNWMSGYPYRPIRYQFGMVSVECFPKGSKELQWSVLLFQVLLIRFVACVHIMGPSKPSFWTQDRSHHEAQLSDLQEAAMLVTQRGSLLMVLTVGWQLK